jgi:hypothetical protein
VALSLPPAIRRDNVERPGHFLPGGCGGTVMVTFVVAIWPGEISTVSAVKTKRATFSQ